MVKVVQRLLVFACFLLSLSLKAESEHVSHYKVAPEADDFVKHVLFDAVMEKFDVSIEYVNYSSFDGILDSVARDESDFSANITFTQECAQKSSYLRPINDTYGN